MVVKGNQATLLAECAAATADHPRRPRRVLVRARSVELAHGRLKERALLAAEAADQSWPLDIPAGQRVLIWRVAVDTGFTSRSATAALRRPVDSAPTLQPFAVPLLATDDVRSGEVAIGHLAPDRYLLDIVDACCTWSVTPHVRPSATEIVRRPPSGHRARAGRGHRRSDHRVQPVLGDPPELVEVRVDRPIRPPGQL